MKSTRSLAGVLLILGGASLVAASLSFVPMFADEHTGVYSGKECGTTKVDCELETNYCATDQKCWRCTGPRSRHFCVPCDPPNANAICELSDDADCGNQQWRTCDAAGACDTAATWNNTQIKCTARFPGRLPNICANVAGCTEPN
jgi:hypothetical protein